MARERPAGGWFIWMVVLINDDAVLNLRDLLRRLLLGKLTVKARSTEVKIPTLLAVLRSHPS